MAPKLWFVRIQVGNIRILEWVVMAQTSAGATEKAKAITRQLYISDYELTVKACSMSPDESILANSKELG